MHTLPSTTFTHSFFEKIIWIDRISLLDICVKKKETKKALESILQIIWRVIAICTPLQFDSKKPLALPGRPYPTVVQVSREKAYAVAIVIGIPGSPKPQSLLRLNVLLSTRTNTAAKTQIIKYQTKITQKKEKYQGTRSMTWNQSLTYSQKMALEFSLKTWTRFED